MSLSFSLRLIGMLQRHVGEGDIVSELVCVVPSLQRDVELGFQSRLVKTRERLPGVRRLKLGHG